MKEETAVVFDNVSKIYPLYHHITAGFKYFLFNLPRAIKQMKRTSYKVFDNVSFKVYRGESFGIIGHNGAGKSTILGLIAGVIKPTTGKITVVGKVTPFLELGAGFHPDLTGRENIILNGILLGMTKKKILSKLDSIIEFSELGDFIEQPIRIYSSGMLARLGFSVAINTEPDILLVDEILSVGDAPFQQKCLNRLEEFKQKGTTIIIVSHSQAMIERLCEKIIVIGDHKLLYYGDVKEGIKLYETL